VQQIHLQELANLFKRFNVQDKFGIHLIHGHFQLDEDNVMLGTALTSVRGCWTKPTSIADLKPAEIHGHIFTLTGNGEMQAYEYREGPTTNLDGVNSAFFQELAEYLQANDLMHLLGLEVLGKEVPEMMCEFILRDNGTVMLDARDVKRWIPYRVTGFALGGPGMTELKGNEPEKSDGRLWRTLPKFAANREGNNEWARRSNWKQNSASREAVSYGNNCWLLFHACAKKLFGTVSLGLK